ncbi:MAG: ThiF family adenylyltransferase, partial [Armatimonadota bacterium]
MVSTTKVLNELDVIVRAASPEASLLFALLYSRYPEDEWGTLAQFGWRETRDGLVVTLASVSVPGLGDMDEDVPNVSFLSGYVRREAIKTRDGALAPGVVHSHPQGCQTGASYVDDDMDTYLSDLFEGYAPGRPYVSLIFAMDSEGRTSASGRVFWKGSWHAVSRFAVEGVCADVESYEPTVRLTPEAAARVARLRSAFGEDSARRLAGATVAVIGASGTGSPAIEALARAGVGHLIVVDPDTYTDSNHERVHGSVASDAGTEIPKVQ